LDGITFMKIGYRSYVSFYEVIWCFLFEEEDGIRDRNVTGVQTCALPISGPHRRAGSQKAFQRRPRGGLDRRRDALQRAGPWADRSEERRVGKESRFRGVGKQ